MNELAAMLLGKAEMSNEQLRAMFASMGGKGKLYPRAKSTGKRSPHAGAKRKGGGAGGGGSTGSSATKTKAPKSPLGDALDVKDADHPAVKAHLRDLKLIPEELANRVKAAGLKKVYVGKGAVPELDDMGHLRNVNPRGYSSDASWMQSGGCYSPSKNTAIVGTIKTSSVSVALHEFGHATGHNLGYDNDTRLIAIHKKLYQQNRLKPYYRQGGPGGEAGRQELFAEAFAATLKNPTRAAEQYGDAMVDFIQKTVIAGKPAKTK